MALHLQWPKFEMDPHLARCWKEYGCQEGQENLLDEEPCRFIVEPDVDRNMLVLIEGLRYLKYVVNCFDYSQQVHFGARMCEY